MNDTIINLDIFQAMIKVVPKKNKYDLDLNNSVIDLFHLKFCSMY